MTRETMIREMMIRETMIRETIYSPSTETRGFRVIDVNHG